MLGKKRLTVHRLNPIYSDNRGRHFAFKMRGGSREMRTIMMALIASLGLAGIGQAGWVPQVSGTGNDLRAVDFTDSLNGVSGGDAFMNDTMARTTNGGAQWIAFHGIGGVQAIDMVTPLIGWAVGPGIFKTTNGGSSWIQQSVMWGPRGVSFCDTLHGLAVGGNANAYVVRTTNGGSLWVQETIGIKQYLYDVCMVDSLHAWACGWDGGPDTLPIIVSRDGGQTWTKQKTPPFQTPVLHAVFFLDTLNGWAVGELSSLIYTTDGGRNWMSGTTGSDFLDIVFADGQYGWMVGCYRSPAAILVSTDGGRNWSPQTPGVTNTLNSVIFIGRQKGWIVGDGGIILHTTDGGVWVEEQPESRRQKAEGKIAARPNPFATYTEIPGHEKEPYLIYDLSGKYVGAYPGDRIGYNLPPGIYLLKLPGKGNQMVKIVKVK
jgi:photosystem II stability/assembly factor-like uncharacterized protein